MQINHVEASLQVLELDHTNVTKKSYWVNSMWMYPISCNNVCWGDMIQVDTTK